FKMQAFFPFLFFFQTSFRKRKTAFLKFPNPNNEQRATNNNSPNNQQPTTNNQTKQRYKLIIAFLTFALALQVAQAQTAPNPVPPTLPAKPSLPDSAAGKKKTPRIVPEKIPLQLRASETDKAILKKYRFKRDSPDSLSAIQEIRGLVLALHDDGFLTASADTFFLKNDTLFVDMFVGQAFKWVALKNGNLSEGLDRKSTRLNSSHVKISYAVF